MTPTPAQAMQQMTAEGRRIENESFAIIDQEAAPHGWPPAEWAVVRRVIHATGDFEFKTLMAFHPQAVERAVAAFRAGASLLVDVQMIEAGLSRPRLEKFGSQVYCHISHPQVMERAKASGATRAATAVAFAHEQGLLDGAVVAVGNAPTYLLELARLMEAGRAKPALVVGVPVGFVSAQESKEILCRQDQPWIVAHGRKGGSPVAVAALHALMALAAQTEEG